MKASLTLKLSIDDLSDEAKKVFRQGFCIDDDDNHLWCSIVDILDNVDDIMPGISLDYEEGWDKNLTVKDLPKSWWKAMNFSPEMKKAMKNFWSKNPKGEIEWTW